MKNKLRKFIGIMVGMVFPIVLNLALAFADAIIPTNYFPLAVTTTSLLFLGAFIFEGWL